MPDNFADRLLAAIDEKGSPVCVGLDPRYEHLPDELKRDKPDAARMADAISRFCGQVLEVVAPHVPAVKLQSAYFEVFRELGALAYKTVTRAALNRGLVVIGDVKRNDIHSTAEAYSTAHLALPETPDAITVNPYFGADGLSPFIEDCRRHGKGAFVLVRTSNESAPQVQDFADAGGKKLYEHVAEQVAALGDGEGLTGTRGYSCVGAVVGATYPEEARRLRRLMPRQVFLVPGYGAQGATAADCAAAFDDDGVGAVVNASRSVIYAFRRDEYKGLDWKQAVEAAAKAFAEDIARAVGM